MRLRSLALIATALFALHAPFAAAEDVNMKKGKKHAGKAKASYRPGEAYAIGKGTDVLFRDPTNNALLGVVQIGEVVQDIRSVGAYTVVLSQCFITVIDATNPFEPAAISRTPIPNCGGARFVEERCPGRDCPDEIFICEEFSGVSRWTFGRDEMFHLVSAWSSPIARDCQILADGRCVVDGGPLGCTLVDFDAVGGPAAVDNHTQTQFGYSGLMIVDPATIFYTTGASTTKLMVSGNELVPQGTVLAGTTVSCMVQHAAAYYFGTSDKTVKVYSADNLDKTLSTITIDAVPNRMTASFGLLDIFTNRGTYTYDISDPSRPLRVRFTPAYSCLDGLPFGDYFAVASGAEGVHVYDANAAEDTILDSDNRFAEHLAPGPFPGSFFVSGLSGVGTYTIGSGGSLTGGGGYSAPFAGAMDVRGNRLFVPAGNVLHIVNTSAFPVLTQVGGATLSGGGYDVSVTGNFAYVAAANMGIDVIDISNESSPKLLHNVVPPPIGPIGNFLLAVDVSGDLLGAAASGNGLHLYTGATTGNLVRTWGSPNLANGVAVRGNYLYGLGYGMSVYDAIDPSRPALRGLADHGTPLKCRFVDIGAVERVLVSGGEAGAAFYDQLVDPQAAADRMLGIPADPNGLDANADGVVDAGDVRRITLDNR